MELIDDAEAAYHIVKRALESGRAVVSGNKKMLAHHLPELIELQQKHNVALLYDASACGSIPVIRNLEEYYDNDLLVSVKGKAISTRFPVCIFLELNEKLAQFFPC